MCLLVLLVFVHLVLCLPSFVGRPAWETTSRTCSYSATACLTVDTRAASVQGAACRAVRPCFLDIFLRPLVPGSYLFAAGLPEECVRGFFWETTSGFIPYSAQCGSTVDACSRQSTEAPWFSRIFCVKMDLGSLFTGRFRPVSGCR